MSSKRSKMPVRRGIPMNDTRAKVLKFVAKMLNRPLVKTKPVQPVYVFEPEPQIRKPLFDYVNLFEAACRSWPLRRAFRAIIQECTRNRWIRQSKFKWKCTSETCEKEYQTLPSGFKDGETPSCSCGAPLREPSKEQADIFDRILKTPNEDYRFDDFVRSSIFYDLALDDWYWGIGFVRKPKTADGKIIVQNGEAIYERVPKWLYVEDARFIFPVADQYGHLGGYEYFCPECYDLLKGDQPVAQIRPDTPIEEFERLVKCPNCGGLMEQTAYVQEIQGVVVARFTKYELIHGSSSRVLPALFGNSKLITVWKLVHTILAMDDYNFEVYNEGKVGAILGFPGYDQLEVDEINKGVEEELKRLDKQDIQTGRYERSKKIRTLMLGIKKDQTPIRVPLMETLENMQSIEFYRLYANAISQVYGTTPTFDGGDAGGPGVRETMEVQNRTIIDHQSNFSDLFNQEVCPLFGIFDWYLGFNPVEARDELRLAQIHQTRAAAAFTYLRGGFDVSIADDGNLIISGMGEISGNEPEGSRAREDRAMIGKPWRWEYGQAGGRTQGQQLELAEHVPIRTPFSLPHSETKLQGHLNAILNWAVKRVKSGSNRESTVKQAKEKADKMLKDSYEFLVNRALSHARKRTGKEVQIGPEEFKRLESWKANSLDDFESILNDQLTGSVQKSPIKKADVANLEPTTRLPASWYETTRTRILDHEFALNGDQNEVYLTIDGYEVSKSRLSATEFSRCISLMIESMLDLIDYTYDGKEGFPIDAFEEHSIDWLSDLKVKYDTETMESIVEFFNGITLPDIAQAFNGLRVRLDKVKFSTLEEVT
jgi:hypothetical protein